MKYPVFTLVPFRVHLVEVYTLTKYLSFFLEKNSALYAAYTIDTVLYTVLTLLTWFTMLTLS